MSLTAKAVLTVLDPVTGEVVASLSGGNRTISVVATDGGKGGPDDSVAVTVRGPSGESIHSVSTTGVGGGNITVKP